MNHDPIMNPPWWALIIFFAALIPLLLIIRGRNLHEIVRLFNNDLLTRFSGLCLVVLGGGLFLVFNYHPLLQVMRRDANVPHLVGTTFLSVLAIGNGLPMVFVGARYRELVILPGQTRTRLKTVVGSVIIAAGIISEIALYGFLVSRGYALK